ncbi:uncharacterized protein DC041_0010265 [Schistosoma bovis]|uniref:Rap-GAP domain-containing protein n=1 Tax=Schistosoma bovis TaxID=6184 RepID=A0A430QGE3_SCHBO|nr:uncharacterized protein DC041_0010265 [Schistosoma bovis]
MDLSKSINIIAMILATCYDAYKGWSSELHSTYNQLLEYESFLRLFPVEVANSIATSTVMSVKCDCSCTLLSSSGDVVPANTDATHDGSVSHRSESISLPQNVSSAPNPRSSFSGQTSVVRFDSPDELRWVMHYDSCVTFTQSVISVLKLDSVSLRSSLESGYLTCRGNSNSPIPLILQKEPQRFLKSLLFSLTYYFLPRDPEPLSDQPKLMFSTLGRSLAPPQYLTSADSSEAPSSFTVIESTHLSALLNKQLDIIKLVAAAVEELCSVPTQLTSDSWDCILRFCLIICHAILSPPLHLPSGLIQSSTGASQMTNTFISGSGSVGGPNSMALLSNHSSSSDVRGTKDSATLFDVISDCVSNLLFSTWLKACTHCFPKPQLWVAFRECARVWRHHNAFIKQWSRVSVALSATLLGILNKPTNLNALRGLSMIVDGFLGIQPSLTIGIDPFVGVIPELYGPIGRLFQSYPSFHKYTDTQSVNNDDGKSRLASVVTSAGILASAGTSGGLKSGLAPFNSTSVHIPHTNSSSLTPIEINASLTNAFQQSQTPSSQASLQLSNASTSGQSVNQKLGNIPPILSLVNRNLQVDHLQNLATNWLSTYSQIILNPQRPEINSLLQLFGAWLFEASVSGVKQDLSVTVISHRATLIDSNRFLVGRAEALGTLCRIMIYAQRGRLAEEYLTRFYLCLYYALVVDPTVKNDYILCLVLFYSIDLLRVDLPGINILIPRIYGACQHVLKEEINMKPEFLSPTLVQRAAIHQLMSMVCIPIQFKGAHLKHLIPLMSNEDNPCSLNDIKNMMVNILCDTLSSTEDPVNFQLLLNTTSSFFNILTPLLCGNLVYKWKNDSSVMLYLLEIISGLSSVHVTPVDPSTYRHTVRSICEFITNQCNREKKDHKRQLHSIIVAAYYCLSSWIVQHVNLLLSDRECVWTILETIELGICGAKSSNKQAKNEPPTTILKGQKPLVPSSKRVCDAAEACLSNLMSVAGSFPGPFGTDTTCSQLAEDNILKLIIDEESNSSKGRSEFHYFWSEPNLIIGLCEFPTNSFKSTIKPKIDCSKDGPAAILIIRGPFGRHVWITHMRLSPLLGNDSNSHDHIIPSLDEVGSELGSNVRQEINVFKKLITTHASLAKEVGLRCVQEKINAPYPDPITEAQAPIPVVSFHPIRLLLTHLGYLSIGPSQMPQSLWPRPELKRDTQSGERLGLGNRQSPSLTANRIIQGLSSTLPSNSTEDELLPLFPFDVENPDFADILTNLDHMPTRTGDTLLVFYVAAGQSKVGDILANMNIWSRLPEAFHQFLSGIGCIKDISDHSGWTGNLQTSYRTSNGYLVTGHCNQTKNIHADHCPDGIQSIIYYADAITELACICPTNQFYGNEENSDSNLSLKSTRYRTASEIITNITRGTSQSAVGMGEVGADPTGGRVAVVWLERWEDGPMHYEPGVGTNIQNMTSKNFDCPVTIYVHPLSSGLCRVGIMRLQGRTFEAGPLQNGSVLSQRCLSSFVRQTVINLSRRRRLASDSFQPPHVRRSHELFRLAEANRKIVRVQPSSSGNKTNTYSCNTANIVRSLFSRQTQIHSS